MSEEPDLKYVLIPSRAFAMHCRAMDKAFDANWRLEELNVRGASAVMSPKSNLRQKRAYDAYKWRQVVENYFLKIKEFRGIATRYNKANGNYTTNWNLVAILIASKWLSTDPSSWQVPDQTWKLGSTPIIFIFFGIGL